MNCTTCHIYERYKSSSYCLECKNIHRRTYPSTIKRRTGRRKVSKLIRKLRNNLRRRLRFAIHTNQRTGSAVRDLGCSIAELITYLESQFQKDMSWDNYGAWQIDHIIPLSFFDLIDLDQVKKACHYTNLQPLWAVDNRVKSNKTLSSCTDVIV